MSLLGLGIEEKCKKILTDYIQNIKHDLYEIVLEELLSSNIDNTKKSIESFVRKRLDLTTKSARHTREYWEKRGWSSAESYIKAKENKLTNRISAFSREFWVEKINPQSGINYTIEEADFERNSRRPIRPEYWIKQGFSKCEADSLALAKKDTNNKTGAKNTVNSVVNRAKSKRCIEYFTTRGHTHNEAKLMVSAEQVTFSKEICIEKHGTPGGTVIWQQRQDIWQATLIAKSDDEKARINKLKLYKGGTVSKGEKLLLTELLANNIACRPQFPLLKQNKCNYFVYDMMFNNKIIEYNGDFWHANPAKYDNHDILNLPGGKKIAAHEIWNKDFIKLQHSQSQGYEVLVIWESDFNKNKEAVIKRCIQFLTQ